MSCENMLHGEVKKEPEAEQSRVGLYEKETAKRTAAAARDHHEGHTRLDRHPLALHLPLADTPASHPHTELLSPACP